MKISKIVILMAVSITFISVGIIYFMRDKSVLINKNNTMRSLALNVNKRNELTVNNFVDEAEKQIAEAEYRARIVYDGMTLDELAAKLDRILNDDLSGKGYLYASHSLEVGVDPYLAVAISLHETGCKWTCSTLVKKCNNVGGQVSSPRCPGGNYKYYETLDEGIIGFIDNIARNYVEDGLLTADQMNPRYAEDPSWSYYVNNYIEQIRRV